MRVVAAAKCFTHTHTHTPPAAAAAAAAAGGLLRACLGTSVVKLIRHQLFPLSILWLADEGQRRDTDTESNPYQPHIFVMLQSLAIRRYDVLYVVSGAASQKGAPPLLPERERGRETDRRSRSSSCGYPAGYTPDSKSPSSTFSLHNSKAKKKRIIYKVPMYAGVCVCVFVMVWAATPQEDHMLPSPERRAVGIDTTRIRVSLFVPGKGPTDHTRPPGIIPWRRGLFFSFFFPFFACTIYSVGMYVRICKSNNQRQKEHHPTLNFLVPLCLGVRCTTQPSTDTACHLG